MSTIDLKPDDTSLTLAVFAHLLSLYDKVVKLVYETRIKEPKKLTEALKDDQWRYEELPRELRQGTTNGGASMDKPQLERLVRWKITHGQNRPFLPSQIRKNDPSTITTTTQQAYSTLTPSTTTTTKPSPKATPTTISTALKTLTQSLHGVGPATASLILSVYNPETIPFFSDELFHWLCREFLAKRGGKIKYDSKEYEEIVTAVERLRGRLRSTSECRREEEEDRDEEVQNRPGAVEVEKVAFVVGHSDRLDEEERMLVREMLEGEKGEAVGADGDDDGDGEPQEERKQTRKRGRAASAPEGGDGDGEEKKKKKTKEKKR